MIPSLMLGPIVTLLAAVESFALTAVALGRPPRRLVQWSFAGGMLGFGAEAAATFGLLTLSNSPATHHAWSTALRILGLLVLVPWGLFVFASGRSADAAIPRGWKVGFAAAGAVLVAGAAAALIWPFFRFPDTVAFVGGQATTAGRLGLIVELLAVLGVLYGLEPTVRNSWGVTRWRMKFLVLGLGGIFVVRLYLLSQMLLFQVELPIYALIQAATLAVGNVFVAASLWRTESFGVDLSVSRHFVYRSVVVAVAGAYLVAVGLAGWVVRDLGIPELIFWGSLVIFVSALGLAALLLSENLRWRVKRYISAHFYPSKYDYREQWRTFTSRLSSRVTLDSLIPQLVRTIAEAVGATAAFLYLRDERDARLHLAEATGPGNPPPVLTAEIEAFPRVAGAGEAIAIGPWGPRRLACLEPAGDALAAQLDGDGIEVVVPLARQEALIGLLLVGRERGGQPYTLEDIELMTVFGEQAAGAVVSAKLSEELSQARTFEAFYRVTSFVIHDLKNSIAALSMLSQNAIEHFDDPHFQRDSILTLSATVDRMKALLTKLSQAREVPESGDEEIDLAALLSEAAKLLVDGKRVSVVRKFQPVPAIRGDREALRRVFQNLLTNAVEAMNGHGEITLGTDARAGRVNCSVQDTGHGMSTEYIRKSLFVPFRSTKKGGWGIGLYQAKQIIEAHGGRIDVESQEGRGTTFTVAFPAIQTVSLAPAGKP
jgi:putative PEP-CTERM system histidine kinase